MPGSVGQRDRKMNIDSAQTRKERAELEKLARPQSGVDALGVIEKRTNDK